MVAAAAKQEEEQEEEGRRNMNSVKVKEEQARGSRNLSLGVWYRRLSEGGKARSCLNAWVLQQVSSCIP